MQTYNGTATIDTIDYGEINIVKWENRKYYNPTSLDLIQDCKGNYYEIWKHTNGYYVAIKIPD